MTQQFNTTTSMGRLTLNMLLSFAQFEREIAGERIRADRRLAGGQHFSRGAAEPALSGDIVHQGEAYPGQHEAILDPELWQIVQNKLAVHRQERALGVGAEAPSLLAGLIVDADGSRMTPTHATKKVKRYRYYVSASLLAGDHPQAQKGMRVPAGDIEALVLDRLRALFSSRTDIGDALTPLDLEARAFDAALRNAFTLSKRWLAMPLVEMKSLVLDIVERVTIAANRIDIWLNRAKIAAALEAGGGSQRPDIHPITLSIDAKLRRAGNGKRIVIANGAEAEVNAGLVELIKDAFTIRIQLLSGSDASIEAMSGRLGMNKCRRRANAEFGLSKQTGDYVTFKFQPLPRPHRWRQVADALVISQVIVVGDEGRDLGFEIARQVIVFEQDAVLERLMPALDLALGHRMIRRHGYAPCSGC